jgi:hypothetical protein
MRVNRKSGKTSHEGQQKLYGGGGGVGRPLLYIGYVYGGYFMAIADTCTCK